MKKIILILLFSFMLTGCFFGEVGSGLITKTCSKVTENENIKIIEEKIIKNQNNEVISVIYKDTVTNNGNKDYFKALKSSYISEINSLNNSNVLTEINEEIENEMIITYQFDYEKISDEIKNKYDLEKLNHIQIKKLEEQGYECK